MSWSFRPEPTNNQKALDIAVLRNIWPYLYPHRRLFAAMMLIAPVLSLTQVARPYLVKWAIDDAIPTADSGLLTMIAGAFLALMLSELVLIYFQAYGLQWLGLRLIETLRLDMFSKLLGQTTKYLQKRPSGVLVTRLTNDLEAISEFFASGVVTLVSDLVKLAVIAGILLWMNARLTMAAFISVPVLWVLGLFFRRELRKWYRQIRIRLAALNGFIAESLSGMETIQSIGMRLPFYRRFQHLNERHRDANLKSIYYDAALYSVVEALASIATGALLWYGGGLREQESISFGELVAFIEYIGMFFVPIRDLSQKYAVMQSAMASGERVFETLDADVEMQDGARVFEDGQRIEDLRLSDIHFGYNEDEPVLHGVSIAAQEGQKIALVGATGSGKTTVLRLLLRQYDAWSGSVGINGQPIQSYEIAELRHRIAVVQQGTFLFSGTLRDNLRLYDSALPETDIESVAGKLGMLEQFGNLDFDVHEGGGNLSQGERQMISLARAMLRKPDILILDEATSSVDPVLEARVYDVAREAMEGGILISVAHRLGTVIDADRIYVFRAGNIVEEGTHSTLMQLEGYYHTLMKLQTLKEELQEG